VTLPIEIIFLKKREKPKTLNIRTENLRLKANYKLKSDLSSKFELNFDFHVLMFIIVRSGRALNIQL